MNPESGQAPLAVALMGPTASGKTALAYHIADRYPCDIISVDSAMVYRGMNIGTSKPDAVALTRYPHRLVDICDPIESYSAARFRADALREMAAIVANARVPLLVGGTMLYFKALQHGLAELPAANPAIRQQIADTAQRVGWAALHAELAVVDPDAAARIHRNDPQRIQRALEVYQTTGIALTTWQKRSDAIHLPYRLVKFAISMPDKATLNDRIARRFGQMLKSGLVDEVRQLRMRGDLSKELPSMRAVGYRQIWEYLDGESSYEEMVERAVIATRQLAKRQMTWLRAERDVVWLKEADDVPLIEQVNCAWQ